MNVNRTSIPRRHRALILALALLASLALPAGGPSTPAAAAPSPSTDRDECSIEAENCVAINYKRRRRFGSNTKQQDCASCVLRCRNEKAWPFSLCPNR